MQCLYQNLFKEGNGDHKYLMFTDIRDNNFEVLHSAIALDKVDLEFSETVKAKPTKNNSGFITYSNTISFSSNFLEKVAIL